MPVVTERRRPASAAIVESAVQTVSKISQIATPGVREISKPEVTPKSRVEAKPTYGNNREYLNAAKIMDAGAMAEAKVEKKQVDVRIRATMSVCQLTLMRPPPQEVPRQ